MITLTACYLWITMNESTHNTSYGCIWNMQIRKRMTFVLFHVWEPEVHDLFYGEKTCAKVRVTWGQIHFSNQSQISKAKTQKRKRVVSPMGIYLTKVERGMLPSQYKAMIGTLMARKSTVKPVGLDKWTSQIWADKEGARTGMPHSIVSLSCSLHSSGCWISTHRAEEQRLPNTKSAVCSDW